MAQFIHLLVELGETLLFDLVCHTEVSMATGIPSGSPCVDTSRTAPAWSEQARQESPSPCQVC